ncbi:MAG: nuclear transport factor 2 family protein [Proteobacteria bacterium]|nr:nuclear transport factor 2 family protein [Pseudomonadota bacterium]
MTRSIEERLQHIEDIDAIRRLKSRYCLYADDPRKGAEFADLFTDDAVLDEGEDLMVVHGRRRIRAMHAALWPCLRLNQHFAFSPVIEIDGDDATGHWRLLQISTVVTDDGDEKAFWSCGWYEENYVRESGIWKIRHVVARVHFSCPYEDGWAKTPFGEFLSAEALDRILGAIEEQSA